MVGELIRSLYGTRGAPVNEQHDHLEEMASSVTDTSHVFCNPHRNISVQYKDVNSNGRNGCCMRSATSHPKLRP